MADNPVPNAFEISSILLEKAVNHTVQESANTIITTMLDLDDKKKIQECLAEELLACLENESFMMSDLQLTDKQTDILRDHAFDLTKRAYQRYKATIKQEKRDNEHIAILEANLKDVIQASIVQVGEEINRGAVVPTTVVKCDVGNPEKKKIELHYSSGNARLTVPTSGLFISSNCVQVLIDSIEYTKPIQTESL